MRLPAQSLRGEAAPFRASVLTRHTEHAAGNLRVLANMGNDLLTLGAKREIATLDQKLYFEAFAPQPRTRTTAQASVATVGRG